MSWDPGFAIPYPNAADAESDSSGASLAEAILLGNGAGAGAASDNYDDIAWVAGNSDLTRIGSLFVWSAGSPTALTVTEKCVVAMEIVATVTGAAAGSVYPQFSQTGLSGVNLVPSAMNDGGTARLRPTLFACLAGDVFHLNMGADGPGTAAVACTLTAIRVTDAFL